MPLSGTKPTSPLALLPTKNTKKRAPRNSDLSIFFSISLTSPSVIIFNLHSGKSMGAAQWVLTCMKTWVPSSAQHGQGVMAHSYNPSTQEVEEGGTEVKGQPWLLSKLEPSLVYLTGRRPAWATQNSVSKIEKYVSFSPPFPSPSTLTVMLRAFALPGH